MKLAWTVVLLLLATGCGESDCASFSSFYEPSVGIPLWGWAAIVVIAVAGAAVLYLTGGTASPAVVSVGTWIGNAWGLSGAAATNFGLALLGGGPLAAHGFGVAGGAALLTAVFTFSTELVGSYSIEGILQAYDQQRFVKESKSLLTLPPPRVLEGPGWYTEATKPLQKLEMDKPLAAGTNESLLRMALRLVNSSQPINAAETCRRETFQALLHFQLCEYGSAKAAAEKAIRLAKKAKSKYALPAYIYAVAGFYDEAPDPSKLVNHYLSYAVSAEPGNKLIPLMCAVFMDRAMYRYRDKAFSTDALASVVGIFCDNKAASSAAESLSILTTRVLSEVKLDQQSIYTIAQTSNSTIRNDSKTKLFLEDRLNSYSALLQMTLTDLLPRLDKFERKLPKGSGVAPSHVRSLVALYQGDEPHLRFLVGSFSHTPIVRNWSVLVTGLATIAIAWILLKLWLRR